MGRRVVSEGFKLLETEMEGNHRRDLRSGPVRGGRGSLQGPRAKDTNCPIPEAGGEETGEASVACKPVLSAPASLTHLLLPVLLFFLMYFFCSFPSLFCLRLPGE